ncbi:uncharacterized protein L201_007739 [Kwoniella dendrophila CBS 6074]|uniref:RFX-type winged-helix domain-containing protein n=1 Tax=Kwoniella dendrophila CBS 6074 TaxID=1295534 RepID=A0AAX4K7J0_9TREE
MADLLPTGSQGFDCSPLQQPSNNASPTDSYSRQQNFQSDLQFDGNALANSPDYPSASTQDFSNPPTWTPTDGYNGRINSVNPSTERRSNGFETPNQPNSSFTTVGEYPPAFQPSYQPQHMLSHASSSSSLASLSSQHTDSGRLLVQAFPTEIYHDFTPMDHSRHSSYSSMSMATPPFNDKLFSTAPLPMDMPVHGVQYTLPGTQQFNNQGVPPNEVFRQQPPRSALQTQNLPGMGTNMNMGAGKATRERSSSRSIPYSRFRSESVSVKSEIDDEMTSMMSATIPYSPATPWSANATHSYNGGLTKRPFQQRRTPSGTPYNTPINTSPPRPMLSRSRRSTPFILGKQTSQPDLQSQNQAAGPLISGSALERQECVRRELSEKSAEIKRMGSQTHQDKARTLWVRKWLVLSYTHAPGRTVPRQGLYHSYTVSCDEYGLKPINSASFGKAVRAAFPGIKTRRLGVRGNSKYHYVSIRPAIQVEAERLNAYGDSSGAWHVVPEDGSMDYRNFSQDMDEEMEEEDMEDSEEEEESFSAFTLKKSPSAYDFNTFSRCSSIARSRATSINDSFTSKPKFARRHTTAALSGAFLPLPKSKIPTPVFNLAEFPTIANAGHLANDQFLRDFWTSFCHHQEILVGFVKGMQFDKYEMNCRTFWIGLSHQSYQIALQPTISSMISDAMAVTYDHIIGVLLEKLSVNLDAPTQNALRATADNLENLMEESLGTFGREFSDAKVELAVRAGHLITRFLDLRQVAFALGPILSDRSQIKEMIQAWERLNIRSVSDQCALSCSCDQDILEQVFGDFGRWLNECSSTAKKDREVEELCNWIDKIVKQMLGVPGVTIRAIGLRVGFITSQIMRDFTLKSEKSFGLFQLLKTFVDDYVSITSLRQTALSSKSVEPVNSIVGDLHIGLEGYTSVTQHSNQSSISSMSNVFVPAPQSASSSGQNDVPYINDSHYNSESIMMDHDSQYDTDDSQTQYLSVPGLDSEAEGNLITPRAFDKDDNDIGSKTNLTPFSS